MYQRQSDEILPFVHVVVEQDQSVAVFWFEGYFECELEVVVVDCVKGEVAVWCLIEVWYDASHYQDDRHPKVPSLGICRMADVSGGVIQFYIVQLNSFLQKLQL